jgi:16S rRNA (guanine527-N7)-methyltransferase
MQDFLPAIYNRIHMHSARIAELLQPFLAPASNHCHSETGRRHGEESAVLSSAQLEYISTYIDILLRWNARINLTAIRDPGEIVTRHFGESLFAARHLFPNSPSVSPVPSVVKGLTRVADLGSGAGFPGIPIKLWAPNIALTLIESNHKKAAFLREVGRALTLTDINIQNTRADEVPQTFDVVTLRAVEHFAAALPIAARLLAPAARVALLIAHPQLDTARSALPRLTWQQPIHVPQSQSRLLLVGRLEQQE